MSKKKNEEMDPKLLALANTAAEKTEVVAATPQLVRKIGVWKAALIDKTRAELVEAAAKSDVFVGIVESGAHAVTSKYGTIPIQKNSGGDPKPVVNWEAVAREGIAPEQLDAIVAKHTAMSVPKDSTPFIKAVSGWTTEAKAAA